jgi:hypothetical protein
MAAKQQSSAATDAVEGFNTAISETAGRGREMMEASLAAWTQEAQRFYDEMSAQGRTALEQLKACQSPVEVLSVEQAWLAARSKAYLESGVRFAQVFAAVAQGHKAAAPVEPPPPSQAT